MKDLLLLAFAGGLIVGLDDGGLGDLVILLQVDDVAAGGRGGLGDGDDEPGTVGGTDGGDDPVVTPTINATKDAMGKAGKTYEPHIYEGATNAFMTYQAEGLNGQTTAQSWTLAMEFLKEKLQ